MTTMSTGWVIAATLLVLGLVYGTLWMLRMLSPTTSRTARGVGVLRPMASLRLGHNQTVHVVEFGGQWLLVGATPTGMALLAQVPAPEEEAHESGPGFAEALKNALKERVR